MPEAVVSTLEIAEYLRDRATPLGQTSDQAISGPAGISPGSSECLSFVSGSDAKAQLALRETRSTLVLIPPGLAEAALPGNATVLVCERPRREFARVVAEFFEKERTFEISPHAVIAEGTRIGAKTSIEAGAMVADNTTIGEFCLIGANAVILPGTRIGDRTRIGPNCTIGLTGFGYAREEDGTPVPMPHSGGVRIGNDVQIGGNTCIDRGTLDDTVIEDFVMIDNLVHIAHNCRIETRAFVIATAILSGSVRIGPRAWIAPNVSVREGVEIGADAMVGLASNVLNDVPSGATVVGSPAKELKK